MNNELNDILIKLEVASDNDNPDEFYLLLEQYRNVIQHVPDEEKEKVLPVVAERLREIIIKVENKKDFLEEYLSAQISYNKANNEYGKYQE